jgi:hypothetical protein
VHMSTLSPMEGRPEGRSVDRLIVDSLSYETAFSLGYGLDFGPLATRMKVTGRLQVKWHAR